jgi:hypothetical protein
MTRVYQKIANFGSNFKNNRTSPDYQAKLCPFTAGMLRRRTRN